MHFLKASSDSDEQGREKKKGAGERGVGTSDRGEEDGGVGSKALLFVGPELGCKWRPAHFLPLYVRVINEADNLLN